VNFGVAPYAFLWNTGEITQNINPANSGNIYYVIAEDANGCTDSSNALIALGENELQISNKKLISIMDLYGRKTSNLNQPLLYIFDDGTMEKKLILK